MKRCHNETWGKSSKTQNMCLKKLQIKHYCRCNAIFFPVILSKKKNCFVQNIPWFNKATLLCRSSSVLIDFSTICKPLNNLISLDSVDLCDNNFVRWLNIWSIKYRNIVKNIFPKSKITFYKMNCLGHKPKVFSYCHRGYQHSHFRSCNL